jgi:hypothetical protein
MVEKMKFTPGLIVVSIAILLFYLRIAILRGQKKRYERDFALKRRKSKGRSKGAALPKAAPGTPPYGVSSWFLVAAAILFMLVGVSMYTKFTFWGIILIKNSAFIDKIAPFWYIPIALGVIVFAFCFKIQKPIED